jgi:5-methylcytosine-specific restriction endonuclease McrA
VIDLKMRRCKYGRGCRKLIPFNESYCDTHALVMASKAIDEEIEQKRLESVSQGYRASERHTRYSNSEHSHELGHAFYQSTQWVRLSNQIHVRDVYTCQSCNHVQLPHESMVTDHITPRITAPEIAMTASNLWLLCRTCHNKKTALEKRMTPEELKSMTRDDWIKLLK